VKGFSLVICAYNAGNRLLQTLDHLAKLNIPAEYAAELLVVDNASIDDTGNTAAAVWQALGAPYAITILSEPRPGKGYAVETGYDAARYSHILTVDDDNWLDSQYLMKAVELLTAHPDVGLLQGTSEPVFETPPPAWFDDPRMAKQLVVGGQLNQTGYMPADQFHVWGAGLVIYRQDWLTLRQLGFSFLTSKVPGKAAGEDSELGLGLWLLGRRAYYSSELKFKHFMPTGRLEWAKIRQNFETFGYVSYYFSLYAAVIESLKKGEKPRAAVLRKSILSGIIQQFKLLTLKQHIAFRLKPREEYYQLLLTEFYARLNWLFKLNSSLLSDVAKIEQWVVPVLSKKA
jgi:glycosyltransferase involved in cell wall biosynthesis